MKKSSKGLLAACSLGLLMLASTYAGATETPAVGEATPTLQELDEVISYAKSLEERIADRERLFYARYNELNEVDALDVTCDFWWKDDLMRGFLAVLSKRGCVPAFFAEAQGLGYRRAVLTGVGSDTGIAAGSCPSFRNGSTTIHGGGPFVDENGISRVEYYYTMNLAPSSGSCYADSYTGVSEHAGLVWQARQDEFKANLIRVIGSDEQLQGLAADLNSLIDEGNASRERAAEARNAKWLQVRCVLPPTPRGGSRSGCSR